MLLQPQDEEDLERTTSLLREATFTFSITDAGGNDMALMRIISATLSAFSALNLVIMMYRFLLKNLHCTFSF